MYWFSTVNNPRYIRRMETRQAEFLVHKGIPLNLMNSVGVYSPEQAEEVRKVFDDADIEIPVEVKTAWYF
jgi:ssDNA thymidine ADP-ribosyltransferase, DarT